MQNQDLQRYMHKGLTAANSQKLIEQEALSTAVRANHYHRDDRSRDAPEDCKALLAD